MSQSKKPKDFNNALHAALNRSHGSDKKRQQRGARSRRKKAHKLSKNLTDLLGQPPLLADEDPAQYFALYEMLRLKFKPRDIVEEIYVRHMMDDAWLVTRYRRMNSHILNMAQPTMGDEWQATIERYRNAMMGSEELLDMRDENQILYDFSQYSCFTSPNDLVAKQFEKRVSEINLIENMISRCMERMRRSHLTLEDFRDFMQQAVEARGSGTEKSLKQNQADGHAVFEGDQDDKAE